MKFFVGGGNEHNAAARIKDSTIEVVKNKLSQILIPTTYLDQINLGEQSPALKLTPHK